jgi:hypothetical protein
VIIELRLRLFFESIQIDIFKGPVVETPIDCILLGYLQGRVPRLQNHERAIVSAYLKYQLPLQKKCIFSCFDQYIGYR